MQIATIERGMFMSFSTPGQERSGLLQLLSGQNFIATAETAVDAFGAELELDGDDTVAALGAAAAAAREAFDVAWSPGVGAIVRGIRGADIVEVRFGIAQCLLHAAANGVDSRWSIQLARPARLLVDSVLLPSATHLDLEARLGTLRVRLDGQDTVVLEFAQGRLEGATPAATVLPVAAYGNVRVILPPIGVVEGSPPDSLGSVEMAVGHSSSIEQAVRLMASAAPDYCQWIGDVTRRVTLTPMLNPDEAGLSGTLVGECGAFQATASLAPFTIGSMFVHEASHQYYNLATRLVAACDQDYDERFYSPFARAMRRLDRMLLAYHAFANVLLYYQRSVDARQVTWGELGADRLILDVRSTETILRDHVKHLSSLGQDLFEPLYALGDRVWREPVPRRSEPGFGRGPR
jgi:HEXXH motif-containing protein